MQIQITEELFYRSWNQVAMKVNEQQSDKFKLCSRVLHTRWNVLFGDDSDGDNGGGGL